MYKSNRGVLLLQLLSLLLLLLFLWLLLLHFQGYPWGGNQKKVAQNRAVWRWWWRQPGAPFLPWLLWARRRRGFRWWRRITSLLGNSESSCRETAEGSGRSPRAGSSGSCATKRPQDPERRWAGSGSSADNGYSLRPTPRSRSWSCWCWSSSWPSCPRSSRPGCGSITRRVGKTRWRSWRICSWSWEEQDNRR